jgi:hypothetical protein
MSKRPVVGKWDVFDISLHESQSKPLAKFRPGVIKPLKATSVPEEGFDVPQYNLVVCFDELANLKSFIQRRGRARLRESKLVILREKSSKIRIAEWERLERERELLYKMEERAVRKLEKYEGVETGTVKGRKYRVPSTGALLDMDNAKGHLDCFCSSLSSQSHVHVRPQYIIREESDKDDINPLLLRATVILRVTLDPTPRMFQSRSLWRSEKNAIKEAAFEAYLSLYHAGLVNDHLRPPSFTVTSKNMDSQDSVIEVQEQFKPWLGVVLAWECKEKIQRRIFTLKDEAGLRKWQIEDAVSSHSSERDINTNVLGHFK